MINNLKIALQKQKKLIALFLLTILVPSLVLSIFGITAIRNEKFRLAQQYENEHKRIADFVKTNISSRIKDLENILQSLLQHPGLSNRDYEAIIELANDRLVKNDLVEQAIILYADEEPFFPLFKAITKVRLPGPTSFLSNSQQKKLKKAEEYEYVYKNYTKAIALYNGLLISLQDRNGQAQMLNHIARNFIKQNRYHKAINVYNRVIKEYSDQKTSSGLPLLLISELQKVECYQQLNDSKNALAAALYVYKKILQNSLSLNEDQYFTYADIIKVKITYLLSQNASLEEFSKEFKRLETLHRFEIEQWKNIIVLRKECIPELHERIIHAGIFNQKPIHFSKTIDQKNYLILAMMIPDQERKNSQGLFAIMIKNDYLEGVLLNKLMEEMQLNADKLLVISDLSSRIVHGNNTSSDKFYKINAFFEDNFPPWIIEVSDINAGEQGIMALHKSFYFWTIITLLIILSSGFVLIVRTVAHDMEVLKIKSDFVSSVSHEFKTPLTSIKVLTERLLAGKVKNPVKMGQYFSVISQDTDRLTRLVVNILDFSKMEEGKKEYNFEETNVVLWLDQILQNFNKENMQRVIEIKTQIQNNLPPLEIDKNALTQVIYNLLDNAIKFSVEKNDVEVIVKRVGESVVIKVKDHGIGIPQNEKEKIFDKFYQGKNAIKYSAKGTGLGLTLVKHTVEAHGGEISVESKLGHGTTFSIILPIKNSIK